jgi:hypothetical protein
MPDVESAVPSALVTRNKFRMERSPNFNRVTPLPLTKPRRSHDNACRVVDCCARGRSLQRFPHKDEEALQLKKPAMQIAFIGCANRSSALRPI